MRYSDRVQSLICTAAAAARKMGHSYVGSIHLLMALSQQKDIAGQLLRGSGVDAQLLRDVAIVLYGRGSEKLPLPQGFSPEARLILHKAGREARLQLCRQIRPVHVLLALLRQEKCEARELMILSQVDLETLFSLTVDSVTVPSAQPKEQKDQGVAHTKLLEQFSEDMLLKAERMDPVIGREREIDAVIGILCRKNKNNPALVGEPGVGKTAIAEGLAQRMAVGDFMVVCF